MPLGVILSIVVLSSFAALVGVARAALTPANTLRLTIFRPWRGDPWPRGVQEDDEVRFDWSPPKPRPVPIQPTWSDIIVTPAGSPGPASDPGDVEVEDLYGETAAIEHVHVDVHRAPH